MENLFRFGFLSSSLLSEEGGTDSFAPITYWCVSSEETTTTSAPVSSFFTDCADGS